MLLVLATVAYFLLAHGATLTGSSALQLAAVGLLLAMMLVMLWGSPWLLALTVLVVAACGWLAPDPLQLFLYAAPVLFPLMFAAAVARSLAPGHQPLIERAIWHLHGRPAQLDAQHRRYARAATWYWVGVLVLMAAMNLAAALWADPVTWSWIGNIISYAVPGLAMVLEYAVRRRVFPVQPYRNFLDFLIQLVKIGPALARDLAVGSRRRDHDPPVVHS